MRRMVTIRGAVDVASIRTAVLFGRDHVVVPVVALVGDVVVRPLGSAGPEFVPAEVLQMAPGSWNYRPVVPDHPNGGAASACVPEVLEAASFGHVFNARYVDGSLKMDAWLDGKRADVVGPDAVSVVERARNGELIEVSVGAWVAVEKKSGVHAGEAYDYVWGPLAPDHLAMLPVGALGACSIDMGCGAPRAARKETVVKKKLSSMYTELLKLFRSAEVSDDQTRSALHRAIHSTEIGFEWIIDVFSDVGKVVYTCIVDDATVTYRRSFTVSEGGEVELADDREEVEQTVTYQPVAAKTMEARAACSCQNKNTDGAPCTCTAANVGNNDVSNASPPAAHDEGDKVKKSEVISRLIANEHSPFDDADTKLLEALSDEKLAALEESLTSKSGPDGEDDDDDDAKADDASADDAAPPENKITEEEAIAALPVPMRRALQRAMVNEQKERDRLIEAISDCQDAYTKKDLKKKDTEELELLARALKIDDGDSPRLARYDFSGRAAAIDNDDEVPEEPKGITKALAARAVRATAK